MVTLIVLCLAKPCMPACHKHLTPAFNAYALRLSWHFKPDSIRPSFRIAIIDRTMIETLESLDLHVGGALTH